MTQPDFNISNRTIFRILTMILAFGVAIFLVISLRQQLIWLMVAFFFALALEPPVNWLAQRLPKKSRGLAVLIAISATIVVLAGVVALLGPPLVKQFQQLIHGAPDSYHRLLSENNIVSNYLRTHDVGKLARENQDKILNLLSTGGVANFFAGIFNSFFAFFAIIVFTFFMVLEWPRWHDAFWRYQDPKKREHRKKLYHRMTKTVSGYINGNLLTSLVAGIATLIFLRIIGIPFGIALGCLVAVLDLIPMLGATLAAIIVSLVVLAYAGLPLALVTVVFFIVYQQFENNLLQPMVFSKTVKISPLVAGVAALFGAVLAGLIGALIAIPAAASLEILVKDYLDRKYPKVKTKK